MSWKEFFKPTKGKILIVFIFLLLVSLLSLIIISKFFVNTILRLGIQTISLYKAFTICTNTTSQNVSDIRECYSTEIEKTESVLNEISKEIEKNKKYIYSLQIIYPGIKRLLPPLLDCSFVNYVKYLPGPESVLDSPYSGVYRRFPNTGMCYYRAIFEVFLMLVYFYLISCLIVWIYNKVRKKHTIQSKKR